MSRTTVQFTSGPVPMQWVGFTTMPYLGILPLNDPARGVVGSSPCLAAVDSYVDAVDTLPADHKAFLLSSSAFPKTRKIGSPLWNYQQEASDDDDMKAVYEAVRQVLMTLIERYKDVDYDSPVPAALAVTAEELIQEMTHSPDQWVARMLRWDEMEIDNWHYSYMSELAYVIICQEGDRLELRKGLASLAKYAQSNTDADAFRLLKRFTYWDQDSKAGSEMERYTVEELRKFSADDFTRLVQKDVGLIEHLGFMVFNYGIRSAKEALKQLDASWVIEQAKKKGMDDDEVKDLLELMAEEARNQHAWWMLKLMNGEPISIPIKDVDEEVQMMIERPEQWVAEMRRLDEWGDEHGMEYLDDEVLSMIYNDVEEEQLNEGLRSLAASARYNDDALFYLLMFRIEGSDYATELLNGFSADEFMSLMRRDLRAVSTVEALGDVHHIQAAKEALRTIDIAFLDRSDEREFKICLKRLAEGGNTQAQNELRNRS